MAVPDHFDVAIVGAGVIGLAIAQRLSGAAFMKHRSLVLLEQEAQFGQHTSSRNSEVIHAGLYYPTGSLKAELCVRGRHLLYEHCERYHVACRQTGKLIVASAQEAATLESLWRQGQANGVTDLRLLDSQAIRRLESSVRADLGLLSPASGIVDSHAFMLSLLQLAQLQGALYSPRTRVERIAPGSAGLEVDTRLKSSSEGAEERYRFTAGVVVCCAGLQSAALARRIDGLDSRAIPRLHLCKGDYFSYRGRNPFRHLIYPVPEANTTGLGIHATLDMAGRLRFGPDTHYIDWETYAIDASKRKQFAGAIRRYFPAIEAADLIPDTAGIRPKLAGPGDPPADFLIQDGEQCGVPNLFQLFGIESPGLTASLAIADALTARIAQTL